MWDVRKDEDETYTEVSLRKGKREFGKRWVWGGENGGRGWGEEKRSWYWMRDDLKRL